MFFLLSPDLGESLSGVGAELVPVPSLPRKASRAFDKERDGFVIAGAGAGAGYARRTGTCTAGGGRTALLQWI